MDIPDAARASLEAAAGSASAKERAVRILSAATVSRAELEHRLRQKGESPENARQAVEWLAGLSLLDDEAAARQIVRSGTAKGYGAARIRQMLYAKHIPRELWDEALAELPEQDDAIDAFLQKRFRGRQPDCTEIRRAADALLRRRAGFSLREASAAAQVAHSRTPMLFIHGGKDAFVPFAMLDEVYAAARCPKEKYVEPDAGHAESLRMAPARYWAKVFGFIGRWMPLPGAERTVAADPAEKPV